MIQVFSYGKTPYPPTGIIMLTPPVILKFKQIQINSINVSGHIRPPGMHSPRAEADILGRIKAVVEGRAMTGLGIDIMNR